MIPLLTIYLLFLPPYHFTVTYRKVFQILFSDHSSLYRLLIYKIFSYTQHEL